MDKKVSKFMGNNSYAGARKGKRSRDTSLKVSIQYNGKYSVASRKIPIQYFNLLKMIGWTYTTTRCFYAKITDGKRSGIIGFGKKKAVHWIRGAFWQKNVHNHWEKNDFDRKHLKLSINKGF